MLEISLMRAKTQVMARLPVDHVQRAGMELVRPYERNAVQRWKVDQRWGAPFPLSHIL